MWGRPGPGQASCLPEKNAPTWSAELPTLPLPRTMAEIEIENPADSVLEEKAEGGDNLTLRIAITTVILAIIAVVFSHFGEEMGGDADDHKSAALLLSGRISAMKNDASEARTKAANQWAYFQSKSTKQSLAENVIALATDPGVKEKYQEKVDRYEKEKNDIKAKAETLDKEADGINAEAALLAGKVDAHVNQAEDIKTPEDQIHLGMPLMQIGIALASITALTRVKWMLWVALLFAAIGVGLSAYGVYLGKILPDRVELWEKAHPGVGQSAPEAAK